MGIKLNEEILAHELVTNIMDGFGQLVFDIFVDLFKQTYLLIIEIQNLNRHF